MTSRLEETHCYYGLTRVLFDGLCYHNSNKENFKSYQPK
ncbi:hypothetical protein EDF81_2515 [Enterobacter sp. BIGb0383]|nr:hypothetical protein EDF81_2515 [Enterobacter sp. BIGb0383]ROS08831.1 hypothetical protein EC848_2323 [Enterobacter sp. BIGb0359]